MPIQNCKLNGKDGFQWGDSGTCYTYDPEDINSLEDAMDMAASQGRAAYASGYVGKIHDIKSFRAPKKVRDNAAKGLALRRKFGRGGLDPQEAAAEGIGSGVVRASTLVNGKVTYDTIKRMINYFSRHRNDKNAKGSKSSGFYGDDNNPSAGYIAWLLWGGDEGEKWAISIRNKVESHERQAEKTITSASLADSGKAKTPSERRFKPGSPADERHQGQPAKPSERIVGSPKNPSGTATAAGASDIKFNQQTENALRAKVKEHNEKYGEDKGKKVTYAMLAAVYRRGSGAFSTSHRPNMTRAQWSYARVNHFLHLVATGKPKDPKYITDNDLLPKDHRRSTRKGEHMENQELENIATVVEQLKAAVKAHTLQYQTLQAILDSNGYGKKVAKFEDYDISIQFPIIKSSDEKRLVTGIVLEPDVVDAHGDFEKAETIIEAAHRFLAKYNDQTNMGLMHKMFGDIGVDLVESYIAPSDMSINGEKIKKDSWVITVKVHSDTVWDKIKKGEITGFSIGGVARAVAK